MPPGPCAADSDQGISSIRHTGADVIAETLRDLGVTTIFCYPGGANLEILDALSRVAISLVRTEHEQGAVFAAQGYARASGRLGVCLVTSGPGATNVVTGVADANSDSVPILVLTGNVATRWLGKNAFQEVDIVAIVRPVTKRAEQVRAPGDIHGALRGAAQLALQGRPGPVLLDFPKDVQQATAPAPGVEAQALPSGAEAGMTGAAVMAAPDPLVLARIAGLLAGSARPVIYAGGGVIASGTSALLVALAERLGCPVVLTLMGLGAMDSRHPLCLGPLGMHGAHCANVAVNEADVVLALGVRFDDRVIGDPAAFAAGAAIVHIDVDPAEIGKNVAVRVGLCADLRSALPHLLEAASATGSEAWRAYLASVEARAPLQATSGHAGGLTGPEAICALARVLPAGAIVTTGVGQHQMWTMQFLRPTLPRSLLSSSGFGTMGFGLPAAIGAKRAAADRFVVDIDGDGSLNMTINELSTCHRYGIGVKVFVVNNQWLGMVRQWQDMIYAGNRVASSLQDTGAGSDAADAATVYPDFLAIASGYRVAAERVRTAAQLPAALARMLRDPLEPYLLDVIVERESEVLPMIPSGKTYRDVIFRKSGAQLSET